VISAFSCGAHAPKLQPSSRSLAVQGSPRPRPPQAWALVKTGEPPLLRSAPFDIEATRRDMLQRRNAATDATRRMLEQVFRGADRNGMQTGYDDLCELIAASALRHPCVPELRERRQTARWSWVVDRLMARNRRMVCVPCFPCSPSV